MKISLDRTGNGALNLKPMLSPFLILTVAKRGTFEQVLPLTLPLIGIHSDQESRLKEIQFTPSADTHPGGGLLGRRPDKGFRFLPMSSRNLAATRSISTNFRQNQMPRESDPKRTLPAPYFSPIFTSPGSTGRGFCSVFHYGTARSVESNQSIEKTTRGRP